MTFQLKFYVLLVICAALGRHVPRYAELDDDELMLYRAAYETPSYDQDEREETHGVTIAKLDLLRDALWMIKAKDKEFRAFTKALAANLLSTKLKLKEILASALIVKKQMQDVIAEKKLSNNHKPVQQEQEPYEPYAPRPHNPYYGY